MGFPQKGQKRKKMRRRFEQQLTLGVVPISEVPINLKSRHELPPVLYALQYVFKDADLNASVFSILENKVLSGKQKTGRYGIPIAIRLLREPKEVQMIEK